MPNYRNRRSSRSHSRSRRSRSRSRSYDRRRTGNQSSPDRRRRKRSLSPRKRSPVRLARRSSPSVRDRRRSPSSRKQSPPRRQSGTRRSRSVSPTLRRRPSRTPSPKGSSTSSHSRKPDSPTVGTLDEELLNAKPLRAAASKASSLFDRYEKEEINVSCIHTFGKKLLRDDDADLIAERKRKDFSPTEVLKIVHRQGEGTKPIFDRVEIKNFKPEETKIVRLLPTERDARKFRKSGSSRESERDRSRERDSRRLKEQKVCRVTDDDLLDEVYTRSKNRSDDLSSSSDTQSGRKRNIQDRLGKQSEYDLRHSLDNRRGESEMQSPVVKEYGHKSLPQDRNEKRRKSADVPDFSNRPDKGKFDPTLLDPTMTPKDGRYFDHDDRDSGPRGYRGRRGGRGWRSYGGRDSRPYRSRDSRDRDRIRDNRRSYKEPEESWKHDKFDELEKESMEPSSTTAP